MKNEWNSDFAKPTVVASVFDPVDRRLEQKEKYFKYKNAKKVLNMDEGAGAD